MDLNTSRCLPSLRYLALAEPTGKPPVEFVDEYDCSPFRWWRVVRDDGGAPFEVKEKPTWEGERVSAFLRAADPLATAGRFDGKYGALCTGLHVRADFVSAEKSCRSAKRSGPQATSLCSQHSTYSRLVVFNVASFVLYSSSTTTLASVSYLR